MTAPVRDPQTTYLLCTSCGYYFTEYELGVRDNDGAPDYCCPRCGSDRYASADKPQPWPAHFTVEGRAALRQACVEIRFRLKYLQVDADAPRELWKAATECLRDLAEYGDQQ